MLRQTNFAPRQPVALRGVNGVIPARKPPICEGIWVPLITPFQDGEVDHDALGLLARCLVLRGIDGLVVGGALGEIDSLSLRERVKMAWTVVVATQGEVPVLISIREADATATGREIAQFDVPVAGFLAPVPQMPGNFRRGDGERLLDHFHAAADATDLPIVLVDHHSRSGRGLTPEVMARLHGSGRFPAVVLEGHAAELLPEMAEMNGPKILCGSETWFFITLQTGGHGALMPLANLVPEVLTRTYDLFLAGLHDAAWKHYCSLRGLCDHFTGPARISALKTALAVDHAITPQVRPPEADVDLSARLRIRAELQAFRHGNLAA